MEGRRMSTSSETAARHEVEQTLHATFYPGTEVMTDVGHLHFKHVGHTVLVPQPSDDPRDPLNWSRMWKMLTMGGMVVTTFSWAIGPLAISTQIPYYVADFNRPLPDIVQFVGISILVLGFSNFLWVPVGRVFGRRTVAFFANLLNIGSLIWRARATTYDSFLGASVLSGIACGPSETLPGMLIADVMFLHERGFYMNLYLWTAWTGTLMGPVISGVMAENYGWRSFWWLCVGIAGFSLVYQLLFLAETRWSERHVAISHDPFGEVSESHVENSKSEIRLEESGSPPDTTEIVVKLTGSPSMAQFWLWGSLDKSTSVLPALTIPFRLFAFPIVQWAAFVFAWASSMLVIINVIQSQAFAGPPWKMTPASVGYTNFGAFVGVSVSLLTAGPLSDWVSAWATRRNGGIRQPEMRLLALIPFAFCTLVGGVIVAVGYQRGWNWESIVTAGYFLLGLQLPAISAISTTYAIDSYKPVAGEILVSATMVKNLWAYGMTKWLNVWISNDGYIKPLMTDTALAMFFILLAIPLYFVGQKFRGWTKDSSMHHEL